MPPRYIIGIDLGTTHTVVAYADVSASNPDIQLFEIEQLIAPGEVAPRSMLPSLRYHPAEHEIKPSDMVLPWVARHADQPPAIFGELARELGSRVPGRLVASAKSWLSHASVDRAAAILPWGAPQDVVKISPLHASASYLEYVKAAWDHRFPDSPLIKQDLVLTIPASFDEAARALTLEAAHIAGLHQVRLLEEPQAACYDWLARHQATMQEQLSDVRLLLVCDVGGGTTDLTLIKVKHDDKTPQLIRVGVGDHLMLGGDNMDLALAHIAEGRIAATGSRLSAADLSQLIQQCRYAKEHLLVPSGPERARVTVLGGGAKLVGGARSTEFSRLEVEKMLVDGFFPAIEIDEGPQRIRSGIVEFGLPYAADPGITRHIAAFLTRHAAVMQEALCNNLALVPDAILLNGGVFRGQLLTQRLLSMLAQWRGAPLKQLDNAQPDLAVARGAVAYGLAKRGKGKTIGGGSARSYFLVVDHNEEQQRQAVCLLPKGTEEGHEIKLANQQFSLRLGEPVRFHLASSTQDDACQPGVVKAVAKDFVLLPPIMTALNVQNSRKHEVAVGLTAVMTEVGTLEVNCEAIDPPLQRWRLEFQLRGIKQSHIAESQSLHPGFSKAADLINRIYGPRSQNINAKDVKVLRNDLEKILGKREQWDTLLLRELFAVLWEGARHRRRSLDHERLWFSLLGYCLRPGFGSPLDDWRIEQVWPLYAQGVQWSGEAQVWAEWWTFWRRIAGGLHQDQQQQLLDDLAYYLRPVQTASKRPPGAKKQGYDDMVRLAASLERLSMQQKQELGEGWLERLRKGSEAPQTWWALGRIATRVPVYGSIHCVIPKATAQAWLEKILVADWKAVKHIAFAATLIARMSGDRERDIDQDIRENIIRQLRAAKAPNTWVTMVHEVTELDSADEQRIFGETLPPGLRLVK